MEPSNDKTPDVSNTTDVSMLDRQVSSGHGNSDIYIDPAMEQKVLKKFDAWVIPQFGIFSVIAYLDRSNIGK